MISSHQSTIFLITPRRAFYEDSLYIQKIGSNGGSIEILTMISVQKCQFLAKSENWTIAYAYCSWKLTVYNECLVYVQSLDFPLIIHKTQIIGFDISWIWSAKGPITQLVVIPLYTLVSFHFCHLIYHGPYGKIFKMIL